MSNKDGHPVLAGLAALIGVGLVVGLIVGLGALGATRVLGLGGDGNGGSVRATSGASLYLPDPQPTEADTAPAFTIDPQPQVTDRPPSTEPIDEPDEDEISLAAGQRQVSPMGRIDLSGTYTGGEGAILMVQRFEDGAWRDFGVTMSVRGELFSTYIQTGRVGKHRFRVADTDSDLVSNEVVVTIG